MFELRWLVRPGWDGPEEVLQYRAKIEVTDYSNLDEHGYHRNKVDWNEWRDVPTVKEK